MTNSSSFNHQQAIQLFTSRIHSIDLLRGIVMVLMALDHVREYWSQTPFRPEDLSQTDAPLFFTRWITYFCAPIFVFLSGISVFLYQQRKVNLKEVSKYLLTRGLWLVVLEVVVISFLLQFGYNLTIIQVIWVIGWGMILLAGLIWLPRWVLTSFVVLLIGGHNLLSDVQPVTGSNFFLAMLHNSPFVIFPPGFPPILFSYAPVPWVAVLVLGYLIGAWYNEPVEKQKKLFRTAGFSALALFVLLRTLNVYGDSVMWSSQARGTLYTFLSFMSVNKYPPSLLFLSMTIGAGMVLLSYFTVPPGRIGKYLSTFGKVPFFYYLLHLPLIVGGAVVWALLSFHKLTIIAFSSSAKDFPPDYTPSLLRTYFVWVIVVVILYFPCRWYAKYKSEHKHWWLTYL
jgi:uncharacterized membrane protein